MEPVIPDLPGLPDNINRASDGNFWCAMVGMRAPALDLALRMPDFRRRMIYRVAPDEWLFPQMNTGFVFKFDLEGQILDALWDLEGHKHPMITSIREHTAAISISAACSTIASANTKFPSADSELDRTELLLGKEVMIGALSRAFDRFRGSGDAAVTIPSLDGAFRPNHRLDTASVLWKLTRPTISRSTAAAFVFQRFRAVAS